jgi:hypothetical protein
MAKLSRNKILSVGTEKYFDISFKNITKDIVEELLEVLKDYFDAELNNLELLAYFTACLGDYGDKNDLVEEFVCRFIDDLPNRKDINIHLHLYDGPTILRPEIPLTNAIWKKSLPATKSLVRIGADVTKFLESGFIQFHGSEVVSPALTYLQEVAPLHKLLVENGIPEHEFARYFNCGACIELVGQNLDGVGMDEVNRVLNDLESLKNSNWI